MLVAFLNDTHCGIRNSSDIFIEYQRRFYEDVFFPYLNEHGIKQIIHLGDYYDNRKTINLKALNANREMFLHKLRDYGITMDILPGNHDCYFKNTNDLNSLKELMGHYMNEVHIIHEPTVMDYDGCKIGLVPWICSENEQESLTFLANCKADIIGGHFELEGFEMQRGIPCIHGTIDNRMLDRFEMVLSGHFHTKSQQGPINYLGSQMEFFWSDAHDQKYFHVFDTETRELTAVPNTVTIFEKIYYDEEKINYFEDLRHLDQKFIKVIVTNRSDMKKFERYIDRIQQQKIYELKIVEDFKEFRGDQVSDDISVDDTETLIRHYIEDVDTDLDKGKINVMISDLMVEAQNVEIA